MKRTPIPPFSPMTPRQAQAKLKKADSEQVLDIIYQYAKDHGLFSNLEDKAIFEKVERWRLGA